MKEYTEDVYSRYSPLQRCDKEEDQGSKYDISDKSQKDIVGIAACKIEHRILSCIDDRSVSWIRCRPLHYTVRKYISYNILADAKEIEQTESHYQ